MNEMMLIQLIIIATCLVLASTSRLDQSPRELISSPDGTCSACCVCNDVRAIMDQQTKIQEDIASIQKAEIEEKNHQDDINSKIIDELKIIRKLLQQITSLPATNAPITRFTTTTKESSTAVPTTTKPPTMAPTNLPTTQFTASTKEPSTALPTTPPTMAPTNAPTTRFTATTKEPSTALPTTTTPPTTAPTTAKVPEMGIVEIAGGKAGSNTGGAGGRDANKKYPIDAFSADRVYFTGYNGQSYSRPFPHLVWYNFGGFHTPARFSFTRFTSDCTPKTWQFVGSTDDNCDQNSNWTELCGDAVGVNLHIKIIICTVPEYARKAYKCLGIRILSTLHTNHCANHVIAAGVMAMRFWEV